MGKDIEKMFSDFLERHEYDEAQDALFTVVHAAFLAGWKAAGGEPPQKEELFVLLPND